MRKVTTVESLEAVVGGRPQSMLMKSIDVLDDGSRIVLANAPIAGFGFRDREGLPHSTLVGGEPGFTKVTSPTQVCFDFPSDRPGPVAGGGVSLVFLLPGVGETLRLNGRVEERSGTRVAIDLEEAWVHCAKCILRSGLWEHEHAASAAPTIEPPVGRDGATPGPLADAAVGGFLAAARFAFVSSWDAGGSSDTSPKGDHPGFIRILDGHTLAIPDRKGNRRTDTFHNLLECEQVSLAAVVLGSDDVLHMSGTAHVTDDVTLLSTMAVGERPPKAALVVRVDHAGILPNEAVRASRMWDRSAHVAPSAVPDLMQLGAQHIARSRARGTKASMTRAVSKGLAASPKILRRGVDAGYRKELKEEGYGDGERG